MPVIYDQYKEPSGTRVYKSTEVDMGREEKDYAYWVFAREIEVKLGPGGGTIAEIYHKVGNPLGLTSSDTVHLVREAKKKGYLEISRGLE